MIRGWLFGIFRLIRIRICVSTYLGFRQKLSNGVLVFVGHNDGRMHCFYYRVPELDY